MIRSRFMLAVGCAVITFTAGAAEAARLNSRVTVTTDVIRLGDIFSGVGQAADSVVGKAPAPGKRRLIGARQLRRIAHDARLKWRPDNRLVTAMVRRASRILGREEIASAIRERLIDNGVDGDLELELSNRAVRVHVATDQSQGFRISSLRYDLKAGKFAAIVDILGPDGPYRSVRLRGSVYTMVVLPVLNRRMQPGDIIRKRDVQNVRVRSRRLTRGALRDVAAIVGQSPRRYLRAGTPIRQGDVRTPVVVAKGSLVTLSLRTPTMTLTSRGRAAEDGSKGDTIRVINTRSRRTVEAVVIAPGAVAVLAHDNIAIALGGTR